MTKRKASVALDTGTESNQSNSTQDNNSNSTSTNIIVPSSNSNSTATQHGPSSVTDQQADCGQEQAGSNRQYTGQQQPKSKKERADNWSTAEITILHRGIECRRDIFYGPPSQATKKNRESAWEAITKEVNAVSTTPRTLSQVMKKFKNEKCRAKRKFVDHDKDGLNNISTNLNNGNSVNSNDNNPNTTNINSGSLDNSNNNNNNNNNASTNDTDLTSQSHANADQMQLPAHQRASHQLHHHQIAGSEAMAGQPSINVVKLAPQNVAKTMIDLPGHVQQIQMPNDDMVLIVPPEMDGLLSGMNIVSDGHHFQKCSGNTTLTNHQHNHQGQQHALQTINAGQGLVNSSMGNGMMARTIPAGSMCSLVYSTGNEICSAEPVAGGINSQQQLSGGHLSANTHNLLHHRATLDPNQGQHQHHQSHHHQLHQQHQQQQTQHQQQHQPQQQQQHQQQQQQIQAQPQQHPAQPTPQHQPQHTQQQGPLAAITSLSASNINNGNNTGTQLESQLKNLLFNLLLKDGPHPTQLLESNNESCKQRNEILALIASSLTKIEAHLSLISKVTNSYFSHNAGGPASDDTSGRVSGQSNLNQLASHLGSATSDNNNNNIGMTSTNDALSQRRTEA